MPSILSKSIEHSWEIIGTSIKDIIIRTDFIKIIWCHFYEMLNKFLTYFSSL